MGDKAEKPENLSVNDMKGLAREQANIGREYLGEQTTANRPDQQTPFGSSVWEDLGDNKWRQTVGLTPQLQEALQAQQGLTLGRSELAGDLFGTAAEDLSQPITWDAMQANEVDTGADARQRAEDAIYGRASSRLDPQWEQREESTRNRLWNQGLRPGDEAWDTEMGNLDRGRTDAYQTAQNEAIMGGGQEASRTFGLDMSRRQQALAEQLRRRTQALGEVGALTQGQEVGMPQLPGFSQAGRAAAPDLMGGAQTGHQNEWDRYGARQGEKAGVYKGAMDLAGAAAPFFF